MLELPVYPGVCPDGVADSYIAATWQDGGEVFTNDYCGDGAQSIFNLLAAFAEETEAWIFQDLHRKAAGSARRAECRMAAAYFAQNVEHTPCGNKKTNNKENEEDLL